MRLLPHSDSAVAKNCHGRRPQNRPRGTDNRLLVADEDVAPREKVKEFAVPPEVAPVLTLRPACFDDYVLYQRLFPENESAKYEHVETGPVEHPHRVARRAG